MMEIPPVIRKSIRISIIIETLRYPGDNSLALSLQQRS
jgi:hypothetical protein